MLALKLLLVRGRVHVRLLSFSALFGLLQLVVVDLGVAALLCDDQVLGGDGSILLHDRKLLLEDDSVLLFDWLVERVNLGGLGRDC